MQKDALSNENLFQGLLYKRLTGMKVVHQVDKNAGFTNVNGKALTEGLASCRPVFTLTIGVIET